ncbi:MAG TPA: M48 family metallopeptidase [Chthonomonadaceae bacterium]|nr:M48 family metallopeptidase [Chthonomonadaceae bacterium]
MEASPLRTLPPRVRFPGLSSAAFEHPADRAALEALRRTPGLDRLFKWLSDMGMERYLRIYFTADSIRVSPRQASRIYNDLREACAILDVREPDLYLVQNPFPNAYTFGMQRHTIVMTTSLVDLMTDTERLEVLGHELGHIKAEHMLYRTMAIVLAMVVKEMPGNLSIPAVLLSRGLLYALYAWFRKSELTADRAGLLTVQDPDVCVSGLLKLVGGTQRLMDDLNPEEFAKQADAYEDMEEDFISLYWKFLMVSLQTHPFPALRAREIQEWARSEEYRRLLRGDYPRTNTEAGKRVCSACKATVTNVSFQFCPECGAPLPAITPA